MLVLFDAVDEFLPGKPVAEMPSFPFAVNPDNVVSLSAFTAEITTVRYQCGGMQHSYNVRGSVSDVADKLAQPVTEYIGPEFKFEPGAGGED